MNAYIVAGKRSAVGKSKRGGLRFVRPDDLAASVVEGEAVSKNIGFARGVGQFTVEGESRIGIVDGGDVEDEEVDDIFEHPELEAGYIGDIKGDYLQVDDAAQMGGSNVIVF